MTDDTTDMTDELVTNERISTGSTTAARRLMHLFAVDDQNAIMVLPPDATGNDEYTIYTLEWER